MTREQAERTITPELAAHRLGPDGMQIAVYATRQRKAGLAGEEADLRGTSATGLPRPASPPRGSTPRPGGSCPMATSSPTPAGWPCFRS